MPKIKSKRSIRRRLTRIKWAAWAVRSFPSATEGR